MASPILPGQNTWHFCCCLQHGSLASHSGISRACRTTVRVVVQTFDLGPRAAHICIVSASLRAGPAGVAQYKETEGGLWDAKCCTLPSREGT